MRGTVLMTGKRKSLITFIALYQAVGFAIGAFTAEDTKGWYQTLEKSSLTPPNFVFPVMWTILYVLIAVAGWMLWERRNEAKAKIPLIIFALYTALNWSWSFVFFSLHQFALAYVWIVLVSALNLIFIVRAWADFRKPAILMIPPVLWTSFAAWLSYAIWMLNT